MLTHLSVYPIAPPPTSGESTRLFEHAIHANDGLLVAQLIKKAPSHMAADLLLQWESWRGNTAEVERLIFEAAGTPPTDNTQALRWAAHNGHTAVVALLLSMSTPSCLSSVLSTAAKNGHTETVDLLLSKNLGNNTQFNPALGARAAFLSAAAGGHVSLVTHLIPRIEAAPYGALTLSQALAMATENGHKETMAFLFPISDAHVSWNILLANRTNQMSVSTSPNMAPLKALAELGDPDWTRKAMASVPPDYAQHDAFKRTRDRLAADDLQAALIHKTAENPTTERSRPRM